MPPKGIQSIPKSVRTSPLYWLVGLALLAFTIYPAQQGTTAIPGSNELPETVTLLPPVAIFNQNPFPSPVYSGCGGILPPPPDNPAFEQQVLDLVNTERANRGLPPFKRTQSLDDSSRYQTIDMVEDNYFEHDSYDRVGGNLNLACVWHQRVGSYYPDWSFLAENAAAGYATPTSVMNGWMSSTGHRENILSDVAWEMGIGYYSGGSLGHYWMQDFGRRQGIYPLIINREAATSTSRQVQIFIYGTFAQMRIKNDNETFTNWQSFQNSFTWTIACGVGSHTVTVELKTSTGTIITSSDSINLTVSGCPYLGGMPEQVSFLYSKTDHELAPASVTVQPANLVTGDAISWSLSKTGNWFNLSSFSGVTPDTYQIIPSNFESLAAGVHTESVTVTATAPPTTEGTPKMVNVRMVVLNSPFEKIYLPIIMR